MVEIVKRVELSEPVKGVPVADRAFVFYTDGHSHCAVTQHRIQQDRLGPGRVVSMRSIGETFARLSKSDAPLLLPPEVFVSTGEIMAWTTANRCAPMWFRIGGRRFSYRVEWPALLWWVNKRRRQLRVFALGRNTRPTKQTVLYHAPLMNIGGDGVLCQGTAPLPRRLDETRLRAIEESLFDSCFTHTNHDKTVKHGDSNKAHVAYWRGKERSKGAVRVSELVRYGRVAELF